MLGLAAEPVFSTAPSLPWSEMEPRKALHACRELAPPEEPLGSGVQNEEEKWADKTEGKNFEARWESFACKKRNKQVKRLLLSCYQYGIIRCGNTQESRLSTELQHGKGHGPQPSLLPHSAPAYPAQTSQHCPACTLRGGPNIPLIRRNISYQVTAAL